MESSFTIRVDPRGTVVRVIGDLDVVTAPRLRELCAELVRAGHYDLIVDLECVGFLDSSGLAVLVDALQRARAHDGSLRVVSSSDRVVQVFRITGLNKTFTIHATVAEALVAVESRAVPRALWARRRSISAAGIPGSANS